MRQRLQVRRNWKEAVTVLRNRNSVPPSRSKRAGVLGDLAQTRGNGMAEPPIPNGTLWALLNFSDPPGSRPAPLLPVWLLGVARTPPTKGTHPMFTKRGKSPTTTARPTHMRYATSALVQHTHAYTQVKRRRRHGTPPHR